jgi:hypothetical protein
VDDQTGAEPRNAQRNVHLLPDQVGDKSANVHAILLRYYYDVASLLPVLTTHTLQIINLNALESLENRIAT